MRNAQIFIRIVLFICSLALAVGSFLLSFFYSGNYGLFGVSRSLGEHVLFALALISGVVVFIFSFLLFRPKITWPFWIIISTVTIEVIALALIESINTEITTFYTLSTVTMCGLYLLDRRLRREHRSNKISVNRDKILVGIPVFIILAFVLYFGFINQWIHQSKQYRYQQQKQSEFNYQLFSPTYLPPQYTLENSQLSSKSDYIYETYKNRLGNSFTIAYFSVPSVLSLTPQRCTVSSRSNDNFEVFYSSSFASYIDSPCNKITTQNGASVYIMQNPLSSSPRNYALTTRNSTLITIDGYTFSEQELGNVVDSFEARK